MVRDRVGWNFVAWGLAVAWCVLGAARVVGNPLPGDVTLHAFGISGLLVSSIMTRWARPERPWRFFAWLAGLAAVMAVAGFFAHQHWIISKIQGTPTWLFWCCAMFFPLFGLVYWLTETKGKAGWFGFIAPAGTVTLTCYVIPYIWYAVRSLVGVSRPEVMQSGGWGLVGAMIFAVAVVWIAGAMSRWAGVRLKI